MTLNIEVKCVMPQLPLSLSLSLKLPPEEHAGWRACIESITLVFSSRVLSHKGTPNDREGDLAVKSAPNFSAVR